MDHITQSFLLKVLKVLTLLEGCTDSCVHFKSCFVIMYCVPFTALSALENKTVPVQKLSPLQPLLKHCILYQHLVKNLFGSWHGAHELLTVSRSATASIALYMYVLLFQARSLVPAHSPKTSLVKPGPLPDKQSKGETTQSKTRARSRVTATGKPLTVTEIAKMGTLVIGETVEVCHSAKSLHSIHYLQQMQLFCLFLKFI